MKGFRTRWLAAALAALFAAGCDYWRNLVDEKPVTQVPLAIEVKDAWTGSPLIDVYEPLCEDSARGLSFSISDGILSLPDAATGRYTLTCRTGPGQGAYFERSKTFDLGRAGGTFVVDMARRGGADWYPEARDWHVWFPLDTVIYFPVKDSILAIPFGSGNKFQYLWSFAAHPGLPSRGSHSDYRDEPVFALNVLASDVKAGPDTLTLTVKSYLGGHEKDPYTVGSYSVPFRWVRNQPPQLEASLNSLTFRVGCKDSDQPRINFRARDPDAGDCDSVVFKSSDANVVFDVSDTREPKEVQRVMKTCSDTTNPLKVRLKNPFTEPSTARVYNRIEFTAWDGNGEKSDTNLVFSSDNNDAPKVEIRRLGTRSTFFPYPEIQFWIHVNDDFGSPLDITVDWGDGSTPSKPDYPKGVLDFEFEVRHVFQDTGVKTVTIQVTDGCGLVRKATVNERIHIIANSPPSIILAGQRTEPVDAGNIRYRFFLSVADANFDNDGDSLTAAYVTWGDGKRDTVRAEELREADIYLDHLYPLPASGSMKYEIVVDVRDAHRGSDDSTFQVEITRP